MEDKETPFILNALYETWKIFLILAAVFTGLMFIVFFICLIQWPFGVYQCNEETESFENRYLFASMTCQIKVNDKWVNWENHREI